MFRGGMLSSGMRIRIRSDPVIFGPPDPEIFSTDPDPDPTCNNGFIKLFLSWTTYKSESTNSSIKWWVIVSNFIPTYLKYKYIFFFIFRSDPESDPDPEFFSAEPDPWKKIPDPHSWKKWIILGFYFGPGFNFRAWRVWSGQIQYGGKRWKLT